MADRLVLGIGNPNRGDDAVGRVVARLLRGRVPPGVAVIEHDGEATALVAELRTARRAWVIDAAQSGLPEGTIQRIDCSTADVRLPPGTMSSHGFGLAEAIGLAHALGVLPSRCVVYAVEAVDFSPGAPVSPGIEAAVPMVADRILAELAFDA